MTCAAGLCRSRASSGWARECWSGAPGAAAGSPHGTAAIPSFKAAGSERAPALREREVQGKRHSGGRSHPENPSGAQLGGSPRVHPTTVPVVARPASPVSEHRGPRPPRAAWDEEWEGSACRLPALVVPSSLETFSYLPCKVQTALKRQHRAVKRKML